jgi:hypothetical protein
MYRLLKKTITAKIGERHMPKCIETTCANKSTTQVVTADGQALPLCAVHYKLWIEGGATHKQSLPAVLGGASKRYGISSGMFLAGLILILYNVFLMHNSNLFSIMSLTGLILLVLSWLVGSAMLHSAHSKIKSRTLTEFGTRRSEAGKE